MIYEPPIKDMLFLLTEFMDLQALRDLPGNEEVDADLLEAVLEEAGKFSSTELLPLNRDADEHGATFENGGTLGFSIVRGAAPGQDVDGPPVIVGQVARRSGESVFLSTAPVASHR